MRPEARLNLLSAAVGVVAGALYGVAAYALFERAGGVMVLSFLVLVPFALGVIAAALGPPAGAALSIVRGLLAVVGFVVVTFALAWEGLICLVFGLPLLLGSAVLGAALTAWVRTARARAGSVLLAVALPFVAAPFERAAPEARLYRTTENSVVIAASPEEVWRQIRSVPAISRAELGPRWSHAIGLPRPVAAVLDREGVGGVRVATFEDGLSFHETVTEWEPGRRLAFRIQARDPGRLDPHVRVGGQTFDVLSGRYDLEPLADGRVLLHLTSTQRVETHLNAYVAWGVGAIMGDLQGAILDVIRRRSEAAGLI